MTAGPQLLLELPEIAPIGIKKALLSPGARRSDVSSSKEANEQITASGRRESQLKLALFFVREYPGKTSLELSGIAKADRYSFARRLPQLRDADLVKNGPIRMCEVGKRNAITWYPVYGGNQ